MPMPWIYMAFDNPSENHLYCSCSNALQSLYAFIVMFWQCMLKKKKNGIKQTQHQYTVYVQASRGENPSWLCCNSPSMMCSPFGEWRSKWAQTQIDSFFLKLLLFQVEEMCCVKRRKGCLSLQNKPEWSHSCLVVLLLPVGSKYSTST